LVIADKLHVFELFFDFFFNIDETRFVAEHGTLASFFGELVETDLMKAVVALFTFPWID